jgi:hypothetical protein
MIKQMILGIANVKFILLSFKNKSGFKINFNESVVYIMGVWPKGAS